MVILAFFFFSLPIAFHCDPMANVDAVRSFVFFFISYYLPMCIDWSTTFLFFSMQTMSAWPPRNIWQGDMRVTNQWRNRWLPAWLVQFWRWAIYTFCRRPKVVHSSHVITCPILFLGAGKCYFCYSFFFRFVFFFLFFFFFSVSRFDRTVDVSLLCEYTAWTDGLWCFFLLSRSFVCFNAKFGFVVCIDCCYDLFYTNSSTIMDFHVEIIWSE